MTNEQIADSKIFQASGVVKSVRVYLPAIFLYRGLSFIRGLVLTWLLAKQTGQYGLLMIALQAINILSPFSSLGLHEAVTRYVPAYQSRNRLVSYLRWACGLTGVVALVITFGLLVASRPLGHVLFAAKDAPLAEIPPLTRATLITSLALVFYYLPAAVIRGLRMFPALATMELFHGVFYFLLTIGVLVYLGPKATYVMWAYVVALLIPALIWGLILRTKLPNEDGPREPVPFRPLAWQLIGYGFWVMVGGILLQAWQTYSLWHLTKFDSALHSDTFAASRLLGQLLFIFGAAVAGVVTTTACLEWEQGRRDQANFQFDLYSKLALLGLLVTAVLLTALRGPLALIFPRQLAGVTQILPATFLTFQFMTILSFLYIQFVLIEKMHLMPWSWLVGLAANVVLALVWIKMGVALTGAADAAAWSCVPAIALALGLIRLKKQPLSPGLIVIILASFLLLLPSWLALPAVFVLLVWAFLGNYIFDDRQRALMIDRAFRRRIK